MMALAQTEAPQNTLSAQDYERLGQRFVSTIKETQVDQQMLSVGPIQKCLDDNRITEEDIKDTATYPSSDNPPVNRTKTEQKRHDAQKCLSDKFAQISDGDLQQLSTQLDLENFGLVQGKSRQQLTDFFTERLQSALYGTGATGEQNKLRDTTLVDHKVFSDIYESKLSKNFLLELSRYCYQDLLPKNTTGNAVSVNSASYYTQWQSILDGRKCYYKNARSALAKDCFPTLITDSTGEIISSNTTDIYKAFADALPNANSPQELLKGMFNTCTGLIPHICTAYTYCTELAQAGTDQTKKSQVNSRYPEFSSLNPPFACSSKLGEKSCTMQAKIKAYRTNLAALKQTSEAYKTSVASGGLQESDQYGYGRQVVANPRYEAGSVSADRSVESMTTLTSTDLKQINTQMVEQYNEEFTRENCEQNPENKQCEKFFYSDDEVVKFQNQGLTYIAATEKEKAEIGKLRGDNKKLREYLEGKGYKDLLEKLNSPTVDENQIIALIQERFSAERSASYNSMANAFEKKQLIEKTTDEDKRDKAKTIKETFQSEGERFNQLLLFNNVVTSFLEVGSGENARSNSAIFEKEFESIEDGATSDSNALEFFSNLGSGPSGGNSSGPNENVVVDLNYIDQVLGAPAAPEAAEVD